MMSDRALEEESVSSSRYSDSSATYVFNRQNASCIVAFEDGDISGDEINNPKPFRYPRARKYSSPPPPARNIAKERFQSVSPPQLSRSSSNFGQHLVQKQEITGSSRQKEESKNHQASNRSSSTKFKSTARVQYPSVPDMSRPKASSPDPGSPQHRDSGPQPQPHRHFRQPSKHHHTTGSNRHFTEPWDYCPSPTYSLSPGPPRFRDDYSPIPSEIEDDTEGLQSARQRGEKDALDQEHAKELWKMLSDEIKTVREEAKKEFEQERLEAEKAVRERLDADREIEAAIIRREAEQAQRIESAIKIRLEADRQAEEKEKRVRDRVEEDLRVLIKTRMAEEFDNLMETTRERLGIGASSPNQTDLHRSNDRRKSDHRGSDIYAIEDTRMDCSEQPPRPRHSDLAGRSFATPPNKPEEYTLSPREGHCEQTLECVSETFPNSLSFQSDGKHEGVPHPQLPRNPGWHEPCSDASLERRRRARHCSHMNDKTHSVHQTTLSPHSIQQIAHAVVDILRGPQCNDLVFHPPNHTATPRHSSSRTTESTPAQDGCCCRGEHGMVKRVQDNIREERHKRRDAVGDTDATRYCDNGSRRVPSLSGSRGSPVDETSSVVVDMIHSDPFEGGLLQSNYDHACVEEGQVETSISEDNGRGGDMADHASCRNGACIGLASSESVTRVDSELSARRFEIEQNVAPFPILEPQPNKEAGIKKGYTRLKRQSNFVIDD